MKNIEEQSEGEFKQPQETNIQKMLDDFSNEQDFKAQYGILSAQL